MIDKKGTTKLVAVAAVAVMVLASLIIVFENQTQEEEIEEQEEIKVIDDRINPYIYQGLTVEILRMRSRSILDKMFTVGNSYQDPPEFYYIVDVDGEVGDSSEVEASGGNWGSGTFNEYDTMLKECRTNFRTPDGQEKSNIKLTIMEIQKSGLLGRKENHIEKLVVDLVYDYKTGRWTGDDQLKDEDGYGHILGEEYELWFNLYQSDYDHDYIPYWTEVNVYGMDPTDSDGLEDIDGDGIPSWWEWKYDYDPLTWDNHAELDPDLDGVENIEEYMMAEYFADPYYPDVYIELDFMEKNPNKLFDVDHVLQKEAQQMMIEKLSRYGISLYFDDGWPDGPVNGGGEYVEYVDVIDEIVGGHMTRWYKHNFADERKGVFRYFQIANKAGVITPSEWNHYDHIVMNCNAEVYHFTYYAFTYKQKCIAMAKPSLHELGHTMGLVPGATYGIDNIPSGNVQWPESLTDEEWQKVNDNYISLMNYHYTAPIGLGIKGFFKYYFFFDFSDGAHGEGDFNDLTHFYLPTFQMDAAILESPDIRNVGFEEFVWTDKEPAPLYGGWEYDENLTEEFASQLTHLRFDIDNAIDYYYRIYVKTDEDEQGRDFRVYIKPEVKPIPALWTLIAEGNFDAEENTLEIYSYEDQVEQILEMI